MIWLDTEILTAGHQEVAVVKVRQVVEKERLSTVQVKLEAGNRSDGIEMSDTCSQSQS